MSEENTKTTSGPRPDAADQGRTAAEPAGAGQSTNLSPGLAETMTSVDPVADFDSSGLDDTIASGIEDSGLDETLPSAGLSQSVTAPTRPAEMNLPVRLFRSGELIADVFKLVRPLGEGGMGEVFVAKDTLLGRRVAIKTMKLPEEVSSGQRERLVRLFRRDAASTAQLNHPNIVTVYQFGEHSGTPFMALEFVRGTPLDVWLERRGAMPEREAISLGLKLAEALRYAHERGVIHRDIKPANLMRTEDGELKVLDFGIALMKQARGKLVDAFERSDEALVAHLGDAPTSAGTPAYMAPEQMTSTSQDERVDVWAYGVTLYELLIGERPYRHPREVHPDYRVAWPGNATISPGVRDVIDACLRYSLEERIPTFDEVITRLTPAREGGATAFDDGPERSRTNITPRSDSFVGRTAELEELSRQLGERATRLVTLTGPGGVGKSRLATQWALAQLEDGRVSEALLCELAESTDTQTVLTAISEALDVPLTTKDPEQQLVWALQRRPGLALLLDGCERVVGELAPLVERWLAEVHELRIILSSREPLGLSGENVLRIDPLPTDGPGNDALTLFARRAAEASPGWECPEEYRDSLSRLIRELDGLPLAIELAAARIRMISPKKMLARMAQRFKILRSSRRDLSSRQATLLGALQWSWDLLREPERYALAQLSVFEGGCTLEEAEEVVDLSELDEDPFVLDVLERLVDQSLVRLDEERDRFSLLVSVQAFARERLRELRLDDETRARHALAFARLGETAVLERAERGGMEMLLAEADNLEAARRWCFVDGPASAIGNGMRTSAALALVLEWRGPLLRVDELASDVERRAESDPSSSHHALGRLAWVYRLLGRLDRAEELFARAEELAREVNDRSHEGLWLGQRAGVLADRRELDAALEQYKLALTIARETQDARAEGIHLGRLGTIEWSRGNYDTAAEHYARALNLARQTRDRRREGIWLGHLGLIANGRAERAEARQKYKEALERARALDDRRLEAVWLGNLGNVEWQEANHERARSSQQRALAIAREVGDRRSEGVWLGNLGSVALEQGDAQGAEDYLSEALEIVRSLDDRRFESAWLAQLGATRTVQGRTQEALELLRSALQLARETKNRRFEARWLAALGEASKEAGDLDDASQLLEEALELASGVKDQSCVGTAMGLLGEVALRREEFVRASALLGQARESANGEGEVLSAVRWTALEGCALAELGEAERARACLAEAREWVAGMELHPNAWAMRALEALRKRVDPNPAK